MNQETRKCQNCHNEFTIEPDDFVFYEKIKVPPPTFCPECRLMRRITWHNERTLYRRNCGFCNKNITTIYAPDTSFPVYCPSCWWSDGWDPTSQGMGWNPDRPLFEQYRELFDKIPRQSVMHFNVANAEYANYVDESKSVYLSYSVIGKSENVFYSKNIGQSQWIFDSFDVTNSENCFQNLGGDKNYGCKFAYFSRNCMDCAFVYDCANCQNCVLSTNLRNKEFYVRNRAYSEDEYRKIVSNLNLSSASGFMSVNEEFRKLCEQTLRKYSRITNSPNSTGDDVRDCKNVHSAFSSFGCENSKYIFRTPPMKDSMDITNAGFSELFYEFIGGGGHNSQMVRFCSYGSRSLNDVHYIDNCSSSSKVFACIGLRNKQYCILNKQYTKEEYESLIPRIIEHMNTMPYVDSLGRTYRYGEFFPPELSPFAYNETIAQEYFPLTKEQAIDQGYRWRDPDTKEYKITLLPASLPDHIKDVDDSITKETIGCAHAAPPAGGCNHQCTTAFRIIPEELVFYRRMNLPLPRLCPNCRHYERLAQRNPLKLWHRKCQCAGEKSENGVYQNTVQHQHGAGKCPNEFETSYSPDRKEVIYCEQCYNAEVV